MQFLQKLLRQIVWAHLTISFCFETKELLHKAHIEIADDEKFIVQVFVFCSYNKTINFSIQSIYVFNILIFLS